MTTWGKGDTGSGTAYTPDTCAFGTPVTYTDPIVGAYTLNFKSTSCPNSNKCDPVVDFTSHWYANGTQTGMELDFAADDDDGDFQASGKTFLCDSGENGGYYWLCAAPCGQIQPNAAGYAPGWCGVHVVQYQKNEGPDATTGGTSDYRFNITLFDANQNQIGDLDLGDAPGGTAVGVDSLLPNVMEVTAGNVDSDPVTFAYGDQSWAYAVSFSCLVEVEVEVGEGREGVRIWADCVIGCCASL
ncbi:hypothetical protein OEA41_002842 [Lepraria neglecta]|uniref:Uncharacterized protein n=1 Tax=Lepraria neglecta TaxID=209136 RepID=A0AAD9Z3R2_9LECA|nr:hypothetical protein OEA41_002842 [Lepraria neglecta]